MENKTLGVPTTEKFSHHFNEETLNFDTCRWSGIPEALWQLEYSLGVSKLTIKYFRLFESDGVGCNCSILPL